MYNRGLQQYQEVQARSGVEGASPHRLVQMLMEGLLQRLAEAKGALQRHDVSAKGEALGKAIGIIGGLRDGLNLESGYELADNLDALYQYMSQRLLEANIGSDASIIDEVAQLMITVKSAWDAISAEVAES
jgi:flagellar protein FliS